MAGRTVLICVFFKRANFTVCIYNPSACSVSFSQSAIQQMGWPGSFRLLRLVSLPHRPLLHIHQRRHLRGALCAQHFTLGTDSKYTLVQGVFLRKYSASFWAWSLMAAGGKASLSVRRSGLDIRTQLDVLVSCGAGT